MKTEWFKSPDEKSVVIAAYAANSSGGRRMSLWPMLCLALKRLVSIETKKKILFEN